MLIIYLLTKYHYIELLIPINSKLGDKDNIIAFQFIKYRVIFQFI